MLCKLFFLLVSYFLAPVVATCNDGGGYSPAPFYFGWFQCAPGNYYTQSDCGTKTQAQTNQECQSRCNGMSNCAGYIAVLNKRGSSSYGTCYYYDRYPSQLSWCFKYPGSIWGQYRDNVATCFRKNKPSATAYCSSYLSIQPSTVTSTTTTTTTNTITATATVTANPVTLSVTSTVTTIGATLFRFVTTTTTTTVSITLNAAKLRRHDGWPFAAVATAMPTPGSEAVVDGGEMLEIRAGPTANAAIGLRNNLPRLPALVTKVIRRTTTVQPPYCLNPAVAPAAKISSACSCLSIPKSTTTVTATPTATASTTTTATVTVTPAPVTSTTTATAVSTVTSINTVTVTTTATVTVAPG